MPDDTLYDKTKAPTEKKSELSTMRAEFLKNDVEIGECKDAEILNNKYLTGITMGIGALETHPEGRELANDIQVKLDIITFKSPTIGAGQAEGLPVLNADIDEETHTFFAFNSQVPILLQHANHSAERKMNIILFLIYTRMRRGLCRLGFLPWDVNYSDRGLTVEKLMEMTGDQDLHGKKV